MKIKLSEQKAVVEKKTEEVNKMVANLSAKNTEVTQLQAIAEE